MEIAVEGDPRLREEYDRCIRCGLCLNSCPTFRLLGEELDSPRGRIYQVAQADSGRIHPDAEFELHMDRCLDCRACVTACPSGVQYGEIIERTRAALPQRRTVQRVLLERLVPYPRRLQAVAAVIRQLQRNGWLGLLAPKHLADLCPRLDDEPFVPQRGGTFAATGSRRARVAFFPGCVQNVLTPELNRATIRVLQRHGCEVVVIPATGCCGALHTHTGLTAAADRLREHNVRVYSGVQADVIVTNTSGCGAALKAYPPPVGERARDVTEFLVDLGLRSGSLAPMEVTVAYQDPCHLAHGQQIRRQPRELMAAIPGLKLVEMERPDQCCGSAGVYNLNQPHIAAELLKDRVEAFRRTGAQVLATANPGCMIQLGSMVPVAHVVELLDASSRINHAG